MKFALPLILLIAFALNACTTLANRRDLYEPSEAQGPYTNNLKHAQMVDESTAASHARLKAH